MAGTIAAQAPTAAAKLAVEFPGEGGFPPHYVTVTGYCLTAPYPCSSLFYDKDLRRLRGVSATSSEPSALRLEYKPADDGISISASIFYGDFDRQETPLSLEKLPRKTIGPYLVKRNDSITLSDLAKFGLVPLTLRVVSGQPVNPWHPILRSNAPSLKISYKQLDRTSGIVTIRNLSEKAVMAFRLWTSAAENSRYGSGQGLSSLPGKKPAIAPRGISRVQMGVDISAKPVNGVYVFHRPVFLTLQSVLFEDGSYEGDKRTAEKMAARILGSQVERQRVARLAKPILGHPQSDDESEIKAFLAAVKQLSEEPDAQMVARLRAEFGNLTPEALTDVRRQMSMGMREEKESVNGLYREYRLEPKAGRETFGMWLAGNLGQSQR